MTGETFVLVLILGLSLSLVLALVGTLLHDMVTGIGRAVKEVTDAFTPRRSKQSNARAYLVPILDDMGTNGKPIGIHTQSVSIGRDGARSEISFPDPTVSRLHARIVEEANNVFFLYDEGGNSGTYVNGDLVEGQPRQLSHGDEIEFGRMRVVFRLASQGDEKEPFLEIN